MKSGLSREIAQAVLDRLEPGARLLQTDIFPGSFSNFTYFVQAQTSKQAEFKFAIRIYNIENGDVSGKARREFQALELLGQHNLPVPAPLLLDDTGQLLGSPGIVVGYVDGKQNLNPANPNLWARTVAVTLARIHAIPCNPAQHDALFNANTEALWFLRYKEVPAFMAKHPDGAALWHGLREKMIWVRLSCS